MTIVVPIHVEALRVSPDSVELAKTALYDFRLLGQDPSSGLGNLIAANNFANAQTQLAREPGMHLHWTLPRAYTRGVQNEETGQVNYPLVPNRWLVVRYFRDARQTSGDTRIRFWLLESDAHTINDGGVRNTTVVPWMDRAGDIQGIRGNFLGKRFDLQSPWVEPMGHARTTGMGFAADQVGYLGQMFQATYGYGETFTAYYPNCSNVLGVWDDFSDYFANPPMLDLDTDFSASYAVVGWVSTRAWDRCNIVLAQAAADYAGVKGDKPPFPDFVRMAIEQNLGWSLNDYDTLTPASAPTTQAVMSGLLAHVPWRVPSAEGPLYPTAKPSADKIRVAIGNNTAEAVSAYIDSLVGTRPGEGDDDSVQTNTEWLLNALQFNQLQNLADGDMGVGQLQEFLHGTAFAGQQGGYNWAVRQKRVAHPDKPESQDDEIVLPTYLARALGRMNGLQRALDRKRDDIAARRTQQFLDWSNHIAQIDQNVVTVGGALSDDLSGPFLADGLLQLFPDLLAAGNYVEAGTPQAPYEPKADAFSIRVPADFPQPGAATLASYVFNAETNARAAGFLRGLMDLGVSLDETAALRLPQAAGALRLVRWLLKHYEAGGAGADTYLADAKTALAIALDTLAGARTALVAPGDATSGLAAQSAALDAARARLAGFVDPQAGVFATALRYTPDPGKAPLPPGEIYAGRIRTPLTALMSWDTSVGTFPGMKRQMDVFGGQNGQPQPLCDVRQAGLFLGLAYFYAHSGQPFIVSAAYYLQMAEGTVAAGVTAAADGIAALEQARDALGGATLSGMQAALQNIVATTLPRILADIDQAQPDTAAALDELADLLTAGAAGGTSLPDLQEVTRGADWTTLRGGIAGAVATVSDRLPLSEQVSLWNRFLADKVAGVFDLQAGPADHYYAPSEPVILLAEDKDAGTALAPFNRNGRAPRLPCRTDDQIVAASAPVTFPAEIAGLASRIEPSIAGLAGTLQALAEEAFLLTPELSTTVSSADLEAAAAANRTLHYDKLDDVALNDPPAGLTGKLPYYVAYNWREADDPFLPIFIYWEADYQFSDAFPDRTETFPEDFLKQFRLGADEIELQPLPEVISNFALTSKSRGNAFSMHGLISLSSAATIGLCNQIQLYCQSYLGYDPAKGPPAETLEHYAEARRLYDAYQDYGTLDLLSQGLSGFNPALVQRAQELQIPITIPQTWTEPAPAGRGYSLPQFWPTSFLHGQSADWPVTWNDESPNLQGMQEGVGRSLFNPLRAGFLKIGQITLVDAFGRWIDLPNPNPQIVSRTLKAPEPGPDDHNVYLAPRLVQPSRLNFDWIAAEIAGGGPSFAEAGDPPAAPPICGWVWANHLDGSLMLYDTGGLPVGSLRPRGEVLHWFPVPGETTDPTAVNRDAMLAYFARTGANPVFTSFVADFAYPDTSAGTRTRFVAILEVLRRSQQFIVTPAMQQDQGLGVLMGRPLVVTQASVGLEQKGLPFVGLDGLTYPPWNKPGPQFRLDQDGYVPYDFGNFNQAGIPGLTIPVRIGTSEIATAAGSTIPYFDDGVVGYFLGGDGGTFYTPVDIAASPGIVPVAAPGTHPLALTPNGPPATLTLLMDPRAAVHATTGILPVRSIAIPPDQYARQLADLAMTFLTAPILVAADPPAIPLPSEVDFGWSWVQVGAPSVSIRPAQGAGDVTFPRTPQQLVDGWLKLQRRA